MVFFSGDNTMEVPDMQPVNCYFCGDSSQPRLMFLIDGTNSAICAECLVETVHGAFFTGRYAELEAERSEAERSEEEEQI